MLRFDVEVVGHVSIPLFPLERSNLKQMFEFILVYSITQVRKEGKNTKIFELESSKNTNLLKLEKQKLYKLWSQIYVDLKPNQYHKLFNTQRSRYPFFEDTGRKFSPVSLA